MMTTCILCLLLWLLECSSGAAESQRYANRWAVEVRGGPEAADALAHKYGLENHGQVGNLRDIYHFVLSEHKLFVRGIAAVPHYQLTEAIQLESNVGLVEQQVIQKRVKKSYSPPTDPLWDDQWYLVNTGQLGVSATGRDLKVERVWLQGITGCDSIVAIVDDGVEDTHPDLSSNYARWLAFPDTGMNNLSASDDHGTSCAGEIAMIRDNNVCGVGVAYQSTITGIKLLGSTDITDLDEASALGHYNDIIEIYSNSWGPDDNGFTVSGPGTLLLWTYQVGVREGRQGKGSIYVWASGNGGEYGDSCAADGYASSIYTISIGSATANGTQSDYDEQCSGKMGVTFVDNPYGITRHVTTTTLNAQCISDFTGTSAACPLASGVIALALEINTNLTWRDVQYLIVYTSNQDILVDGEWITNGAGLRVSHKFGFGVIDAEALVTRARQWISVPEQESDTVTPSQTDSNIDPGSSVEITFTYSGNVRFVEHTIAQLSLGFVGVTEDYINNQYQYYYNDEPDFDYIPPVRKRGDLQIELLSPSGTRSTLLPYRDSDVFPGMYQNWPFMSVHFWGENPAGQWTLTVRHRGTNGTVSLVIHNVTFYGTADIPAAVQRIPTQCDPMCARRCAATGSEFCDACVNLRNAYTLECISQCPPGYTERNGYCYNSTRAVTPCERQFLTATPTPSSAYSTTAVNWLLSLCVTVAACSIVTYY